MENNDTTVKDDNEVSSSDENEEAFTEEEEVNPVLEPRRNSQRYLYYLAAVFLVVVGSIIMVDDLYGLISSYEMYLSTSQMSFWDLAFQDKLNFFTYTFRYLSLGLAQIVVGLLLYFHIENKNDLKAN